MGVPDCLIIPMSFTFLSSWFPPWTFAIEHAWSTNTVGSVNREHFNLFFLLKKAKVRIPGLAVGTSSDAIPFLDARLLDSYL